MWPALPHARQPLHPRDLQGNPSLCCLHRLLPSAGKLWGSPPAGGRSVTSSPPPHPSPVPPCSWLWLLAPPRQAGDSGTVGQRFPRWRRRSCLEDRDSAVLGTSSPCTPGRERTEAALVPRWLRAWLESWVWRHSSPAAGVCRREGWCPSVVSNKRCLSDPGLQGGYCSGRVEGEGFSHQRDRGRWMAVDSRV